MNKLENQTPQGLQPNGGGALSSNAHSERIVDKLNLLPYGGRRWHKVPDGSCVDVIINSNTLGVSVDVNGYKKGPNALGHDIFSFWVNKNDALVPIKSNGYQDDEQLQAKIEACGTDDYRNKACAAGAHQSGYPCTIQSNQKGNGLGCSWFAVNDVSPDDPTKGYWESLPR